MKPSHAFQVQLALRLAYTASRYLPEHIMDDQFLEWATPIHESKRPLPEAWRCAKGVPALCITHHRPVVPVPGQVASADRWMHRMYRVMSWCLVLLLILADLTYMALVGLSGLDSTWLTILLLNVVILGHWVLVHRGGYVDLPWMRVTRLASLIKLVLAVGPLILVTNHVVSLPLLYAWVAWHALYGPWEAYWDVHRPLQRRTVRAK